MVAVLNKPEESWTEVTVLRKLNILVPHEFAVVSLEVKAVKFQTKLVCLSLQIEPILFFFIFIVHAPYRLKKIEFVGKQWIPLCFCHLLLVQYDCGICSAGEFSVHVVKLP